jgi:hypothetical protein
LLSKAVLKLEGDDVYCTSCNLLSFGLGMLTHYHNRRSLLLDLSSEPQEWLRAGSGEIEVEGDLTAQEFEDPFGEEWGKYLRSFIPCVGLKVVDRVGDYRRNVAGFVEIPAPLDEGVYKPSLLKGIRSVSRTDDRLRVALVGPREPDNDFLALKRSLGRELQLCSILDEFELGEPSGKESMMSFDAPDGALVWLDSAEPDFSTLAPRVTRALALKVPIILLCSGPPSDVPHWFDFCLKVETVNRESVLGAVGQVVRGGVEVESRTNLGRRYFLERASYRSVLRNLRIMIEDRQESSVEPAALESFALSFGRLCESGGEG